MARNWFVSAVVGAWTRTTCRAHVALLVSLSIAGWPLLAFGENDLMTRGARLYSGDIALRAHLEAHDDELPPMLSACIRCHGAPAVPGSTTSEASFTAPDLRRGWLSRVLSRRNGPPSAYDASSLCRALRSGIDPVDIKLPARMPRFMLSDGDCTSLWSYLSQEE